MLMKQSVNSPRNLKAQLKTAQAAIRLQFLIERLQSHPKRKMVATHDIQECQLISTYKENNLRFRL